MTEQRPCIICQQPMTLEWEFDCKCRACSDCFWSLAPHRCAEPGRVTERGQLVLLETGK